MRKITFVLALLMFAGVQVIMAQTTITGLITSLDDGQPIPGVSVLVKGTTVGVTTDINGRYSLEVPAGGEILQFSFVGMTTKEVTIGTQSVINVVLETETTDIEGVVVTALGVSREKKSLGYATQQVSGEELNRVKTDNFINNLSGKAAGVQIRANNNMGGSTNVVIRGSSSLTGNNQALFVVDGVPVNNANTNNVGQASGRSGFDYGNAASDINPNDIASMSILKGAAATALYGSRAANGVIMITTKKGTRTSGQKAVGVALSSNITTGFIDKSTFPKYQENYGAGYGPYYSGGDYPGLLDDVDVNGDGVLDLYVPTGEDASMGQRFDPNLLVYQWDSFFPESPTYLTPSPWIKAENGPIEFFETPISLTNTVEVTGGGEVSDFRLSYTNYDQKGILPNSHLVKHNVLLSGSYDVVKNLKVTASANYTKTDGLGRNQTGYNDNTMSSFRQWYQMNVDIKQQKELYELTEQNITWNPKAPGDLQPNYWDNPYFQRYKNFETDTRDRVIGYVQADWKITEDFSLMGRASIDTYSELQEERRAIGSVATEFGVERFDETSGYSRFDRSFLQTNLDLMGRYYTHISDNFNLSLILGTNISRSRVDEVFASTNGGLIVPDLYSLSNSVNSMLNPEEAFQEVGVNGIFASASLGFYDLLFLDANIRRDQSSTLPKENNAYYYPSVSASFLFSNMIDNSWLQLGKLRVGYAEVGNDAPFASVTDTYRQFTTFNKTPLFSLPATKNNKDLMPERTTSLEAGLELSMFATRLRLDLSVYQDNTVDQIMPVSVSYATGYNFKFVNAGEIENKGIEVQLGIAPIMTDNFRWDITLNWAQNRNEVVSLAPGIDNLKLDNNLQGGVSVNARVGEPYGTIQGSDYVYDDNGNKIVGANGYYLISSTSDIVLGNVNPDWIGGLNNRFSYRGWSFSFLIDMQKGGDVFSLDQYYGLATGLYEETDFTNDLGNPVRDPITYNDPDVGFESGYAPNSGGFIYEGVLEEGSQNNIRVEGGDYLAFGYENLPNRRFVYDAGYVKLREVVLSYSIPSATLGDSFIRGATFSIYGSNLWIIDKNLPHADPEAGQSSGNIQGWQSGVMPTTRNVGLSVNLQF